MSKERPPYLIKRVSRHGKTTWYVWRRPGPQIRLREPYGTKAFWADYRSALYGEIAPKRPRAESGSLAELIAQFQQSSEWKNLAESTRATRERILNRVCAKSGNVPAREIDRAMIIEGKERASSPFAAHHLITTLRSLFKWAVETDRLDENPAQGIATRRVKTEGYHTWTDEEVARYEARWPLGSRERLWFAILLHTGLRRSDVVRLRWDHIRNGVIEIVAKKNKADIVIPLEPELEEVFAASPVGEVYLVEGLKGEPLAAASFTVLFGKACKKAGVPGRAHGVRKTHTTRLAYAGGTVPELNAALGWTGSKMAMKYTEQAERARLAKQVYEKARKQRRQLPPSKVVTTPPEN